MLREDIRIPGHKFSCGAPASAKGNEHAIAKRPPERPAINPFVEPSHALAKQACWGIVLVMGLVMFGIAVLSTISILAVEAGADPNLGLVVFYLSSGFFVTFFTATFTQLAPRMRAPALWAGMGRAANNVCAFTTSGISLALVTSDNVALIMIGALVLLVAACAAFVAAGLFRLPQTEQERKHQQLAEEALAAPTIEEQRQAFIANHALTPREVDVLIAVTQDERPLKQIAEELGISMRMVQRHLSSIYQKTDTQTRAGLTKAFPSA